MNIDWKTQESKIVKVEDIFANEYNPNKMPKLEIVKPNLEEEQGGELVEKKEELKGKISEIES